MGTRPSKAAPKAAPKPSKGQHGTAQVTDLDRAVLQLKMQRDDLAKAERRSAAIALRLRDQAAAALRCGERDRALGLLKRRQAHERQLEGVRGMQANVHASISAVEQAQLDAAVLGALKAGAEELRQLQRSMGDVEAALESVGDAVAEAQATSDLLTAPVLGDDDVAELEADLERWTGVAVPSKPKADARAEPAGEATVEDVPVPTAPLPDPVHAAALDAVAVPQGPVKAPEQEAEDDSGELAAA